MSGEAEGREGKESTEKDEPLAEYLEELEEKYGEPGAGADEEPANDEVAKSVDAEAPEADLPQKGGNFESYAGQLSMKYGGENESEGDEEELGPPGDNTEVIPQTAFEDDRSEHQDPISNKDEEGIKGKKQDEPSESEGEQASDQTRGPTLEDGQPAVEGSVKQTQPETDDSESVDATGSSDPPKFEAPEKTESGPELSEAVPLGEKEAEAATEYNIQKETPEWKLLDQTHSPSFVTDKEAELDPPQQEVKAEPNDGAVETGPEAPFAPQVPTNEPEQASDASLDGSISESGKAPVSGVKADETSQEGSSAIMGQSNRDEEEQEESGECKRGLAAENDTVELKGIEPVNAHPDQAALLLETPHRSPEPDQGSHVVTENERVSRNESESTEQPLAVIPLKAYGYQIPEREPNVRFDIRSKSLQRKAGVEMEEGKVYEIHGKIGGICDFSKTHLEKKGNHVIIMVPREHRDEVRHGERYDISIERVEEKRTFQVEGYQDRTVLSFQPSILKSLGLDLDRAAKSEVLTFDVANLSKPLEAEKRLFTQLQPHDDSARLSVTGLGWRKGNLVEVRSIETYSRDRFVREFNDSNDTKRAKLLMEDEKPSLEVDGRRFPMVEPRFGTHQLQVNLSAKMEPVQREMRFWYDGKRFTPKIGDCKILGFSSSQHELKIVHEASQHRVTASRFYAPSEIGRRVLPDALDVEKIAKNMMTTPRPSEIEGKYLFQVQPPLNDYANDWLYAGNFGQLNQRRGTFSEELASKVLERSGWDLMKKHPSAKNGDELGCNKPGFDREMRWGASGVLGLFEFRWYQNIESAFTSARADAMDRISRNPSIYENPSKGAYVGILDWNQNERRGELHVKKIWPAG